jgi:hemerythrin
MSRITKIKVAEGIYWIEIPDAQLFMLCGCPADSIKHLMKRGLIIEKEKHGVTFETGPNAILLSDVAVQNGEFSNLSEFPVMQMLYRQGMILPGHPNNTGTIPLLIGSESQVKAQMEYIYRGNYGLVSETELMGAGLSKEKAHEVMRLKLKFAFGNIKPTEELIDSKIVGSDPVEIKSGVFASRIRLNVFEIQYQQEYATVNLNLGAHKSYDLPYPLGYFNIRREYFAVVHSGQGDGWDRDRPCMSSILMFQGKIYLIDAGPNILHSLKALGIGVNEIEGIFHTHAHDDHFSGLTSLMRADHKIKYFASRLVRTSVIKKISALASIEEEMFDSYFDVHDLELESWNDIDGLEVKPILSPHPVETTVFIFRTMSEAGYRSYAHFADIVGLDILKSMITDSSTDPGVSSEYFDEVKSGYFIPTDLKKLDIGGGLIHGNAIDFKEDTSEKIILSHTSLKLTPQQKEIGSGAPFGMVDTLIASNQAYLWKYAFNFLQAYFPSVPRHEINMLLNNPVVEFNPESILIKRGTVSDVIYLILAGDVEIIRSETGLPGLVSAGAFVGERSILATTSVRETYRALNFVQALCLPRDLYLEFEKGNGIYSDIEWILERRAFLQNTWLFGESISYPIQIRVAKCMNPISYETEHLISMDDEPGIYIVIKGRLEIFLDNDIFEILKIGDFFGENSVLFGTPPLFKIKTTEPTEVYYIKSEELINIPIVYWKLFETYERRMEMLLNPELISIPIFQWRQEYETNVQEIDNDHKQLCEKANKLYEAINLGKSKSFLEETLGFLIHYTEDHFIKEENLMEKYNFPEKDIHKEKHKLLVERVLEIERRYKDREIEMDNEFIDFLKDWIINHILTEDRKIGPYLNEKGVY